MISKPAFSGAGSSAIDIRRDGRVSSEGSRKGNCLPKHHFGMPTFSQARWFNRTEVTEVGKKENKKDKGQSDQKKSPPNDSGMRVIGQKRKR
jgi:hypothetical protein